MRTAIIFKNSININARPKKKISEVTNGKGWFTLALTTVLSGLTQPDNLFKAGMTYRLHVTMADTGLPGSPKTNWFPFFPDIVANVVGLLQR